MKFIALLFILIPLQTLAIEPMDNYYANDLLDAVDQAKSAPHHYDYSNSYRYKRTTAQSINLNRLNLEELDDTRLKTERKISETDTDVQLADTKDILSTSQTPRSLEKKVISLPQSPHSNSSYYASKQGELSSSDIQSNSILTTTLRP